MTERIDHIIQEIQLKFQIFKEEIILLKSDNSVLLNKIESLQSEKDVLSKALLLKEDSIKSLQSEIEDLKTNISQPKIHSVNNDLVIEELVREIDECINLLKK